MNMKEIKKKVLRMFPKDTSRRLQLELKHLLLSFFSLPHSPHPDTQGPLTQTYALHSQVHRRAPSLRWETTVPTLFFRCEWLQKVERSNLWTLNIKKNTTTSPNLQCFSVWLYLFLLCLQAPVYSTITCSIWEKQQTSLAYCLENTALSWWDILLYTFACYLLYLSDLRRSVTVPEFQIS